MNKYENGFTCFSKFGPFKTKGQWSRLYKFEYIKELLGKCPCCGSLKSEQTCSMLSGFANGGLCRHKQTYRQKGYSDGVCFIMSYMFYFIINRS